MIAFCFANCMADTHVSQPECMMCEFVSYVRKHRNHGLFLMFSEAELHTAEAATGVHSWNPLQSGKHANRCGQEQDTGTNH